MARMTRRAALLAMSLAAGFQGHRADAQPAPLVVLVGGSPSRLSFAASSALPRQLEQAAGSDPFLPADEAWRHDVERTGGVWPLASGGRC